MIDETQKKKLASWLGTGAINIFGRPFSGKDTQAQRLAAIFNAPIIGGGDILRNSGNKKVVQIISTGSLVPTRDYIDIVLPYFKQDKFSSKPLVLSSVGRWHGEEENVNEALESTGHPLRAVVLLNIDESEARKRIEIARSSGDRGRRSDDAHGSLDTRLEEFRNKTVPVIEFYRDEGLLIEVDGNQPRDEVTKNILNILIEKAQTS